MQPAIQKALCPLLILLCASCICRQDLTATKSTLTKYYTSGKYENDVETVTKSAAKYFVRRANSGQTNLAVAFDIDDTALSDWPYIKHYDFGFEQTSFDNWVERGDAPAIKPVLGLYEKAKQLNLKTYFITGRKESQRLSTQKNLVNVGYTNFEGLLMRQDGDKTPNRDFKALLRKQLAGQNLRIIANISDQECDLAGGFAERSFKIPNPFYTSD